MPGDPDTSLQPLDFSVTNTEPTPSVSPKPHRTPAEPPRKIFRPYDMPPPPQLIQANQFDFPEPTLAVNDPFRPDLVSPFQYSYPQTRSSTKYTRPFNAYGRMDSLPYPPSYFNVTSQPVPSQSWLSLSESMSYAAFKRNMLQSTGEVKKDSVDKVSPDVPSEEKSSDGTTSPECPPSSSSEGPKVTKRKSRTPDEMKDEAYWSRRRKNNEAAKRSRDTRRAKEDEIAIKATFYERENLRLKVENSALRNEVARLRCMLYNS